MFVHTLVQRKIQRHNNFQHIFVVGLRLHESKLVFHLIIG